MRGIMSARTKPLAVVDPVGSDAGTTVAEYQLPPAKGSCKMVDAANIKELVDLLKNEAKVL
jgi:electron transfer flavoprotein beta subunit